MKTFLTVLFFCFIASTISASVLDTTIEVRLSPDKTINTVIVKEISSKYTIIYELIIDNMKIVDSLDECYQMESVSIIDLDVNDLFKEIVITGLTEDGPEGEYCKHIYKLDKSPLLLGKMEFYYTFFPDGSGSITADKSTSWCSFSDVFKLSAEGNRIEKAPVDYYLIKTSYYAANPSTGDWEPSSYAVVVKPFKLLTSKDEKSDVAVETKTGEKITLIGYDCKTIEKQEKRVKIDKNNKEIVTEHTTYWNWIKMKTESGIEGWILLKACAFEEIIDGVHCVD